MSLASDPAGRPEFKVLIDFDTTLFDTGRFSQDLWQSIADESGISYEQIRSDGKHHKLDPVLGGYNFVAHITSYCLDSDKMWARLASLVEYTDYLYEDSAPFIQSLLAGGYSPSILSFGEKQFQEAKILPNLARLVGEHAIGTLPLTIVAEKKSSYIAQAFPGLSGVLIDDVPGQNLPRGFTEIHIDRTHGLATPEAKPDGFAVSTLTQALQIIHSL